MAHENTPQTTELNQGGPDFAPIYDAVKVAETHGSAEVPLSLPDYEQAAESTVNVAPSNETPSSEPNYGMRRAIAIGGAIAVAAGFGGPVAQKVAEIERGASKDADAHTIKAPTTDEQVKDRLNVNGTTYRVTEAYESDK